MACASRIGSGQKRMWRCSFSHPSRARPRAPASRGHRAGAPGGRNPVPGLLQQGCANDDGELPAVSKAHQVELGLGTPLTVWKSRRGARCLGGCCSLPARLRIRSPGCRAQPGWVPPPALQRLRPAVGAPLPTAASHWPMTGSAPIKLRPSHSPPATGLRAPAGKVVTAE